MPYVEGQTIHDADSHVMELPGTINRYIDPKSRAAFAEKTGRGDESPHWSQKAQAQHDNQAEQPRFAQPRRGCFQIDRIALIYRVSHKR